jgi:hypothetical protein
MKTFLALSLTAGLLLVVTGCSRITSRDEEEIRAELETSDYTDESHAGATDDGTNQPKGLFFDSGSDLLGETLPWVRFVRKIDRPVTRQIVIDIPAYPGYPETTARATITAHPTGFFYVDNDRNSHIVLKRTINDQAVRKVYLTKHDGHWFVRRMTPFNMSPADAPYPIDIASVRCEARPSGLNYEYTSADSMMSKRDLPAFLPGDTVKVTVRIAIEGDSGWTFLHRGRKTRPHGIREPFFRDSLNVFEREWVIADDTFPNVPAVRPVAIDVIGGQTLFSRDSLAPYNCRVWTFPYVVVPTPDAVRP